MINIRVNGKEYRLDIDPDTPLLWALRDHLKLTGTKFGCGVGECGACVVHMDGDPTRSCVTSVSEAEGREITTIEGIAGPVADELKKAWTETDAPQCGYCQPGQIMTAAALLKSKPHPSDSDIDNAMSGVLCRCGSYGEVRKAIHKASGRKDK